MSSQKSYFNDALIQLKSAGFSTAFGDCIRLLKYSTGHGSIFNPDDFLVDKHIREIFKFSIRRRLSDEPISHIVGFRDFWKSKFMVNQGVLDPRPETELIVEKVIASALSGASILELGTGTGCIATSIALERPDLKIFASEISSEALNIAKHNAKNLGAKVNFFHSDWFKDVRHSFDLIISNPPYLSAKDLAALPLGIKRFEPRIALDAGKYGLDCLQIIASQLSYYLNPKGIGLFEIGVTQKEMVKKLFKSYGFHNIQFFLDLEKRERVVCVKKDA
tara:strand:+ start:2784 stop:3614 length:831 start_codon:yes stop_codon:yes gene_type:complete